MNDTQEGIELGLTLNQLSRDLDEGIELHDTGSRLMSTIDRNVTHPSERDAAVVTERMKFFSTLVGIESQSLGLSREEIASDPMLAYKIALEEGDGILGSIWAGIKKVWEVIWGTITKFVSWFLGIFGIKMGEADDLVKATNSIPSDAKGVVGDKIDLPAGSITLLKHAILTKNGIQSNIAKVANMDTFVKELGEYSKAMLAGNDEHDTIEDAINGLKHTFSDVMPMTGYLGKPATEIKNADEINKEAVRLIDLTNATIERVIGYDSIKDTVMKAGVPENVVPSAVYVKQVSTDETGLISIWLVAYPKRVSTSSTPKEGSTDTSSTADYKYTIEMKTVYLDLKNYMDKDKLQDYLSEYNEKYNSVNGTEKMNNFEQQAKNNVKDLASIKTVTENVNRVADYYSKLLKAGGNIDPQEAKSILLALKAGIKYTVDRSNGTIKLIGESEGILRSVINAFRADKGLADDPKYSKWLDVNNKDLAKFMTSAPKPVGDENGK